MAELVSPLPVDFLPGDLCAGPGRLGLTYAPGRSWSDGTARDLGRDLDALVDVHHARRLVSLIEPAELVQLGIPHLVEEATARGLVVTRFPIPDYGVPRSLPATLDLVDAIVRELKRGDTVVVHCRGGRGRTGMIAACCATACGAGPEDAITRIRDVRPGTLETPLQELFVVTFAAALSPRRMARRPRRLA